MTTIERAAKAIMDRCEPSSHRWAEEVVRAVLQAIREPSAEQIAAARAIPCDAESPGGVVYSTPAEAKALWAAMIDAALDEGE